MAQPGTVSFAGFRVKLGNGASPEVFSAPCGFIQKALNLTADSSDVIVPDCDDPEAPAWKQSGVTALSAEIQGAGVLALEAQDDWEQWFDDGVTRNILVEYEGGGSRTGSAILTALGASTQLGSDGNLVQRAVTIKSAGPWPYEPA